MCLFAAAESKRGTLLVFFSEALYLIMSVFMGISEIDTNNPYMMSERIT